MSFGFSIGDFFAVGNLAWTLYKSCKGAGGAFEEISHEVIALHTGLRELEDEVNNSDSIFNRTGAGKKKDLGILVQNCNGALQQLNKLLIKYKSLGTPSKKTWDRLRFGQERLQEIRGKIMNNTSSLNLFLTTLGMGSLGRIEKKLDQLIDDVRAGRREGTVLTIAEDDGDEAEIQWNMWKKELVDEGFTKMELEGHRQWIKAKLSELIEGGALQEEPQPEAGDSSSGPKPPHTTSSQTLKIDKPKASYSQPKQTTKQSNITKTPKIAKAFHATVEDESDEDGEDYGNKGKEKVVEDGSGSAQSPIYTDVSDVEDVEEMMMNDDASDGASENTDDTFLPSDSISNVATKIATPVLESQTSQTISPTPQPGQESDIPYNKKEKSSHSHDKSFQNKPRFFKKSDFPPKGTPTRPNHNNDAKDSEPYINSDDRSSGGFQFSSPESIFSEFLRNQGRSGESDGFEDFSPTSSRRNGQRAGSRSRSKIPLRGQSVDESSLTDDDNREYREPSSRLDPHHQVRFPRTTAAQRVPREYDEYYNGKPRAYHPETQTYSWPTSPEPPPSYNGRSGRYFVTPSNDDRQNGFSFSNPDSIFAEFLREQPSQERAKTDKPDFHRPFNSKVTIVERPLPLSLEELFIGTHKKMKVKRKVFDEIIGKRVKQDRIVEIEIRPGLEKGSKIKFPGLGDQVKGGRQDLHFIVEEKPHPLYRRDGNNLHHTVQLDLVESLCGWSREVTTIDGKLISIEKSSPTKPGSFNTYPGLGMPLRKFPKERGDFIVELMIEYPSSLSVAQKAKLRDILSTES